MTDAKTSIIISAEDKTAAAFASARNGLQGLEAAASRLPVLGAALATAFSGAAFTAAIGEAIKFTASLDDMAEKTGASVETLSGLARVAQIGGHELGLVEQSTIKLAKGLADADDKSSSAGRALKALGLNAAELRSMDTGQALKVIADRLYQFQDGAGKSALAMDLLGKSGAQALPFLKDLAEQGDLVVTTTTAQAAAAERYEKNMNRLRLQVDELSRSIANKLVPALNQSMEAMNKSSFGGTWSANVDRLVNGGDLRDRIKELKGDLAGLEAGKQAPGTLTGGGLFGWVADKRIARLRETIAAMEAMADAADEAERRAWGGSAPTTSSLESLAGYVSSDEKAPKAKKDKANPYAGLAGFDDNRSAKEIMDALHRVDEQAQRAEESLIAMTDVGKVAALNEQLDLAAKLLMNDKISFEGYDQIVKHLTGARAAAGETKDAFKELGQTIDGWGKQSAAAIADFVVEGKGSFEDLTKSFAKELTQMVIYQNLMKPLATGASNVLSSIFSGAGSTGTVPAYAQGTNYVPNDGLAYLHKGEAVVPASYNTGSSGGLVVYISNNNGSLVSAREVPDGRGGRALDIQIGEMVAAQMATPGTAANRAMRAPTMVRR